MNDKQLKSVKWYDGPLSSEEELDSGHAGTSSSSANLDLFETVPRAGSSLRLRLVQRPQITTLALPRSRTWPSDLLPPLQAPFHFLHDIFNFAKFMLATPAYLISNLTRDLDELAAERRSLSAMNDPLSIIFVDSAERKVRGQIAKAAALETPSLKDQIEKAQRDQHEIDERYAFHVRQRKAEEDAHPPTESSEIPSEFLASRPGSVAALNFPPNENNSRPPSQSRTQPRQRRNLNPPPPSTSTYYYYQAASGLPLFLHPLDIRILLSHFHSYSAFPDTITIRVESVTEGTVNDDLRKRCKYLAHMPEGADVVFVEADLEGVVGPESLKNFEGPLKMRTTRRKEKGRKEDRAKIRAEERDREKVNMPWSATVRATAPGPIFISDLPIEDFSALGYAVSTVTPTPQLRPPSPSVEIAPVTGAWGARSFASALHSSSSAGSIRPTASRVQNAEDEWDIDVAWHELEQRNGGGGRKKRANKLVVLGSGGGGARRR